MKNSFFLVVGIAVIAGSFYLFLQKPVPERHRVAIQPVEEGPILKVGELSIPVELADTNEERSMGLSGRASLEPETGLLFLFDSPAIQGFWMKDMNFPIDIVWIDEDWTVIGVERNISPETFPNVFRSPGPAKYVLELNSGDASKLGIDTLVKVSLE